MATKKKDVVVEVPPQVEAPMQLMALTPVHTDNKIAPTFGLTVDGNMAVAYVTSARRKQLKAAKEEAGRTRKWIMSQMTEITKQINSFIPDCVTDTGSDWVKSLNTVFKINKVNLVAFIKAPSCVNSLDTNNCFDVTKYIAVGDPLKVENILLASNERYFNSVQSESIKVKASQKMVDAFDTLAKCQTDIIKVTDVELAIQKEINSASTATMKNRAPKQM